MELLKQLNVIFKYQYYPKWCTFNDIKGKSRKGIYDFLLSNSIFLIETDGEFHSKDNDLSGMTIEESRYIDDMKDKLAKENGYEVIRIDCNYNSSNKFEYMKSSVLKSKISEIFDLSKIDWKIINEFAISNLEKVVCEYKNNNPELSVSDLCKIMNMGKTSIINFLKQGNELGWCSYDAKTEMRKGNSKRINKGEKQVICLNNEQVFKSAKDIDRQSEEIFGLKLDHRSIGGVCRKEHKHHKGYKFMFYEEYLKTNTN
jgi:transposase